MSNSIQNEPFQHATTWGNAVKDVVKSVGFEVGNLISELVIFYSEINGLKAMGVKVTQEKEVVFPQAFKKEYASPPSGWKR